MDRTTKVKNKLAAGIYVPPSLRAKIELEQQEKAVENENMNTSNSTIADKEGSDLAGSPREKCVPIMEQQEEAKKPRGRGRGRRKPEIQVYVPRARRGPNQESHSVEPKELGLQDRVPCPMENDARAQDHDKEMDGIYDAPDELVRDTLSFEACQTAPEIAEDPCVTAHPIHDDLLEESFHSHASSNMSYVDTNNQNTTDKCDEKDGDEISDDLKFEYYDPAIVAFLPPAKQTKTEKAEVSNITSSSSENIGLSEGIDYEDVKNRQETDDPNASQMHKTVKVDNIYTWEIKEVEMGKESIEDEEVQDIISGNQPSKQEDIVIDMEKKSDASASGSSVADKPQDITQEENDTSTKSKSKSKHKKTKKSKEGKESSSTANVKEAKPEKKKTAEGDKVSKELPSVQPRQQDAGEDNEDSWDAMFDDEGDCLDDSLVADITAHVGKVEIDKPKIDYWTYVPKEKECDVNFEGYSHILEIYDFPPDFGTHDIIAAFKDFISKGLDIKWVDDTHALGVFSSAIAAKEALKMFHLMVKVRPMSEASRQGLNKAKSSDEFLQPFKARPQTTSMAARRLVAGALGMAPRVSREVREQERNKLKAAKDKRKQEKQQKVDIWDGSFGKCAMDG